MTHDDPAIEQALAKADVVERVTPRLLATLDQIKSFTHACLADEGHTPEEWREWDDLRRDAFMRTWRRKHGRKHPGHLAWPPYRAEWMVPE